MILMERSTAGEPPKQDTQEVQDVRPTPSLGELLTYLAHPLDTAQQAFIDQARQSGKKILLCYLSHKTLSQGMSALEHLGAVITYASARGLAVWWLADDARLEPPDGMTEEQADSWRQRVGELRAHAGVFFDASGAFDAAIALCDAYYGTPSVTAAARAAEGMMAVWMNPVNPLPPAVLEGRSAALGLNFIQGCWIGDDYYFAAWRQNGVFRMKRGATEAEYVCHVPVDGMNWRHIFFAAYAFDDVIYFLPTNTYEIWAWNRTDGTWESFPLDKKYEWQKFVWFTQSYRIGDDLWLKPVNYGAIVRFHLPTRELTYFTVWGKKIHAAGHGGTYQYVSASIRVGSELWFGGQNCGCVVRFSMKDGLSKTYDVPEAKTGIANLAYDGKEFWIYAKSGDLLQWSPETGVKNSIPQILAAYPKRGWVLCYGGKIWAFAHWADAYVRYDPATGKMFQRDHYLPEDIRSGLGCAQVLQDGDDLCIVPNFGDLIVHFDLRTETATARPIVLAAASEERLAQEAYGKRRMPLDENAFYDAREVALYLSAGRCERGALKENENTGQAIYGAILYGER